MKKLGMILAIIAIIALAGCGSGGGGGGAAAAGGGAAPFIVDLSTLALTKNASAFTKGWDDLLIDLPATSMPSDMSGYTRVTIDAKYFSADGTEIAPSDSMVMVTMIYDPSGDIRGPSMGPGANTPVKEFNVGGFSGMIHKDRGVRCTFSQVPRAVLLQNNAGSPVAFAQLTKLVFHNGNFKSE
ncbi:MAG: hypothetical protein FWB77_01315 [Treponema sp.]|nr:hypothetical protein [Treponema sp.]